MTEPTTQAAHSGTCPSDCSRVRIGQPQTLGDLRRMTACFADEAPLAVRNAPLPTLYYLLCDGQGHVEIEIPDIHANAPADRPAVAGKVQRDVGLGQCEQCGKPAQRRVAHRCVCNACYDMHIDGSNEPNNRICGNASS